MGTILGSYWIGKFLQEKVLVLMLAEFSLYRANQQFAHHVESDCHFSMTEITSTLCSQKY